MADRPTIAETLAASEQAADELYAIETGAAASTAGTYDRWLADVEPVLVAAWDANVPGDKPPTLEQVNTAIGTFAGSAIERAEGIDPTGRILAATADAVDHAGTSLINEGGTPFEAGRLRRGRILNDPDLLADIHRGTRNANGLLFDGLTELLDMAENPDLAGTLTLEDFRAQLRGAHRNARNRALTTSRYATNKAANMARRDLADQALDVDGNRIGVVWQAERDACVRCLAYSGQYAGPQSSNPDVPDATFRGGLSMDPKQAQPAAPDIPGPPLHPHCRCQLVPWSYAWGNSLPEALQREAERSALKGWAVDSESNAARLRAARAQLRRTGAPSSRLRVKAPYTDASRRLKRDPDGFKRSVPGRPPRMPPPPDGPVRRPRRPGPPRLPGDGRLHPSDLPAGSYATKAEAIAASNRARRRPRRRATERRILDDEDAMALLGDAGLDPSVAAQYTDDVAALRRRIRAEASRAADDVWADLERIEGTYIGTLPRTATVRDALGRKRTRYVDAAGNPVSGDWDWLETADPALIREMTRRGILRPNTITIRDAATGTSTRVPNPDAGTIDLEKVAQLGGNAGVLSPNASNAEAAQYVMDRAEAYFDSRSVAGGRTPRFSTRTGAVTPDVADELGTLDFDVDDLWDATEEAAAARLAVAELEAMNAYEAGGLLQRRTSSPPVTSLTAAEYAEELAAVDTALRDYVYPAGERIDPLVGEPTYTADELYALQRYDELIPEGLVADDERGTLDAHTLSGRLQYLNR